MQAEHAGVKAPGAWHPPKTTSHLNPCPHCPRPPRATPLPLPSLTPPRYLLGRPKFKTFCVYIIFFLFYYVFFWGDPL